MTKKIKTHARSRRYVGPLCTYSDVPDEGFIISDDHSEVDCIECLRSLGLRPPKRDHTWSRRCMYPREGTRSDA